jgi:hypothetical protein
MVLAPLAASCSGRSTTPLTRLMAVPTAAAALRVVATGRLTPVTQPPR